VDQEFEVRVDVSIRNLYGGNMQLAESFQMGHCDFGDMAEILHGFHELALAVRKAKEKPGA
jgi:hypothetical protein